MLLALVAPITMLAEEVRTGKLGGICSVNKAASNSLAFSGVTTENGIVTGTGIGTETETGTAAPSDSHCDWCVSVGLAFSSQPTVAIPFSPGNQLAFVSFLAIRATSIPGLPFSRGPPTL